MSLIANKNSTGKAVIIIGAITGFLSISAVFLRICARKIKGVRLDASDWTCIAGLIFALALLASTVNTVLQGLGLPVEDVSYKQLTEFIKGTLVGIFTWTAGNTLVRISMILLYIQLFPSRKFVIFCWAFLMENVLCAVATFIAASLICQPFAYNWNQITIEGHCGDKKLFWIWHSIQNLLSDVIIILMPMPLLWGLHLPLAKKLSLSFIFAMGFGICIITLIRTIEIANANEHEITRDYASVGVLSILEPLLGVINSSLPLLRPIVQYASERLGLEKSGESTRAVRPLGLHSIGSKRTRAKAHDPYPLDTIHSINENSQNTADHSYLANDGESTKNLVS